MGRRADAWDVLAAARRLSGSGLAVARDRLRGPVVEGVPRRIADVTPAWLESALRSAHPDLRVRAVERTGGHSGTTTRACVAVESEGSALSPTLFVKITPEGVPQQIFGHASRLAEMEVRFYRELAHEVPVRVPRVHVARVTRDGARFVLVLEDLAASGARFVAVGERLDVESAQAVMAALAALHASFWESPRFEADLRWVRCLERRAAELRFERFLSVQVVGAAVRRFGGGASAAFHDAARLVFERRDALEAFWADGPRTLVHGDCHVGNLFFESGGSAKGERPEVGFLDWQVLARAPGLRDVAYFLCNSLPTELRERHQEELLGTYLAALRQAGADAPSEQRAWEQYRGFALYCWLAAAFTAGARGLQPEPIARAGLERATRAVEALASAELFGSEA
jgi:aminoglycoside phosphotransferase (APT) family kinase protein